MDEGIDEEIKSWREKDNLLQAQALPAGGVYWVPRPDGFWGVNTWEKKIEDGSARLFLDGEWDEDFPPPWEEFAEARAKKVLLFIGTTNIPEQRPRSVKLGPNKTFDTLDAENKMVVNAIVTHNGMNYHTARCDKGAIYIDPKFTSHLPAIGGKVTMIVRLKEADRACPFACVKVLRY
jgi:hypothetical protein